MPKHNWELVSAEGAPINATAAPTTINIGTSTAACAALTVDTRYAIYAPVPCFIKIGGSTVTAATTDVYLEVGMVISHIVTAVATNGYVACIGSVAGGKVYIQPCL